MSKPELRSLGPFLIGLPALLLLAFLANQESLKCFFLADDFLCLDYIYQGFHGQPEILWQRLVSPWQDRSVSLFYRPICDLLFFADYAFWNNNAFGYHLSNIALHCAATAALYFLFLRVFSRNRSFAAAGFAFVSTALFSSYPLHVEPIAWLVGRADLIAAFCIFACMSFSISAIDEKRKNFGILPFIFYVLALLSKEAAACAPALILAYWFTVSNYRPRLRIVVDMFMPFVIITVCYLLFRAVVLGSMLGGYTGSLGDVLMDRSLDNSAVLDSLSLFSSGLNLLVFKPDSPEVIALHALYLLLAALMLGRAFLLPWNKDEGKLIAFLAIASLLSCIPALQVIGLTGALSNSRVFYLPSAFFAALLVALSIPLSTARRWQVRHSTLKILSTVVVSALAILFVFISKKDYEPWIEASNILIKMQTRAVQILRQLKPDQRLVLINLTSNQKGAHVFYETVELKTLLGKVFFTQDYSNKLLGLDEYPDFGTPSIGRLQRILQEPDKYQVWIYDLASEDLKQAHADPDFITSTCEGIISAGEKLNDFDNAYWINFDKNSFIGDQAQLQLTIDWSGKKFNRAACLAFSDNPKPVPENYLSMAAIAYRTHPVFDYHFTTFELRRFINERACSRVYVQMPQGAKLLKAQLLPAGQLAQLKPDLKGLKELTNGNYQPTGSQIEFDLDVSRVPGAKSMVLEQADPNYLFRMGKYCIRDPQQYRRLARKINIAGSRSKASLKVNQLEPNCRHAFRLCALDAAGNYTGFYSDTVAIDLRENIHD